jgi:hypothetical protein
MWRDGGAVASHARIARRRKKDCVKLERPMAAFA